MRVISRTVGFPLVAAVPLYVRRCFAPPVDEEKRVGGCATGGIAAISFSRFSGKVEPFRAESGMAAADRKTARPVASTLPATAWPKRPGSGFKGSGAGEEKASNQIVYSTTTYEG